MVCHRLLVRLLRSQPFCHGQRLLLGDAVKDVHRHLHDEVGMVFGQVLDAGTPLAASDDDLDSKREEGGMGWEGMHRGGMVAGVGELPTGPAEARSRAMAKYISFTRLSFSATRSCSRPRDTQQSVKQVEGMGTAESGTVGVPCSLACLPLLSAWSQGPGQAFCLHSKEYGKINTQATRWGKQHTGRRSSRTKLSTPRPHGTFLWR